MSNWMNVHDFLLLMLLNHLMTELVFFHWLISKDCLRGELMLSKGGVHWRILNYSDFLTK